MAKYYVTTITKVFKVTQGKYEVEVKINKDHIEINKEYVFKSANNTATLDRWEGVLTTLLEAVRVARKHRLDILPEVEPVKKRGGKK